MPLISLFSFKGGFLRNACIGFCNDIELMMISRYATQWPWGGEHEKCSNCTLWLYKKPLLNTLSASKENLLSRNSNGPVIFSSQLFSSNLYLMGSHWSKKVTFIKLLIVAGYLDRRNVQSCRITYHSDRKAVASTKFANKTSTLSKRTNYLRINKYVIEVT